MDHRHDTGIPDGDRGELYCIIVTRGDGQMDEGLAAAMEEVYKTSAADPNRWHNNPEKKRKALEGLGRVLAEWEEENGAFTDEEMARARALIYGADVHS